MPYGRRSRLRNRGSRNAASASGHSMNSPPTIGSVKPHSGNGVGWIDMNGNDPVNRAGSSR